MRWAKRILIALLAVALVLGLYGVYLVRRPFPQVDGRLEVAGLREPVEVFRDDWGIPHIFASNTHDLFFAQGYTHAQERFWQMDFWRHIGSGRLAEMFGESQVDTDRFLRTMGWADLARRELELMDPELRGFQESYAAGVNAYLAGRSGAEVSLEHALLRLISPSYEIEPWAPVHTLTWGKVMSWDLSSNMGAEIERAILARTLSLEEIEQLAPPFPEEHPVIVDTDQASTAWAPPASVPDAALPALLSAKAAADGLWALTGGGFEGIGSNNWVLSGAMTESGMPLLANDIHLGIQMPSIWFANGLHCLAQGPECPYRLVGLGFVGVPGIVIGHNGHIAWGVTNQAVDTQDLYIERVNPENPGQYEVAGEWVDFETRTEVIEVAGGEDLVFEVRSTRNGPVISGTFLEDDEFDGTGAVELPEEYVVTLSWKTLEPSTIFDAVSAIQGATNYEEFRQAVQKWDIAAQSVVYADTEGNIAYHSTGKVPVRARGDGRFPVPGWTSEYRWTGVVPTEEMPHLLNPPRGFIATANQMVLRPGVEPFIGVDSRYGYRAARIDAILQAGGRYDVASMQRMQLDARDGGAEHLVPFLLEVPDQGHPGVARIQALLEDWSRGPDPFQTSADSAGAAAYQAVWRHVLKNTFHDRLPEAHRPTGGGRWSQVVRLLLESPDDPWWDDTTTPATETRDDILFMSMVDADEELTELLGSNADRWAWGRLHRARFENQTLGQSGIAPIEWLFNRSAPPRVGGTESVINAVGWSPDEGFGVDWVPSARMVIDLADFSNSTFIHTTGQSGHAFHRHYTSMIEPWTDGEQAPMYWTREEIVANAASTLVLVPADS